MRWLFFYFFLSFSLYAQETRWVDLEWDTIEDATEYEVELFEVADDQEFSRGTFKTLAPKWSHSVAPGKYFIRLRSIDERGVPGEWSEKVDVKVKVLSPLLLRPSMNEKLMQSMVSFEWKEVSGATSYQLVVLDSSGKVLHNAVTPLAKETVYLKDLGAYKWTVFSLENDDEAREEKDFTEGSYKAFERVGGELEAPALKVQINEEVKISWEKIPDAQSYEVDFLPPQRKGEKNRRYTVVDDFYIFSKDLIKEGVSTVTVKALAKGYQDSARSLVKIVKNENSITTQDNVTGRSLNLNKPLTQFFWRHQVFSTLSLSRPNYQSKNVETDTQLKQKDLIGAGLNLEWWYQNRPESYQHRFEAFLQRFSSDDQAGIQSRLAYHFILPFPSESKLWSLGIGPSLLMLPIFLGDRTDDSVSSEQSTSLGPEFMLGLVDTISPQWHFQANVFYAQHLFYLANPMDEGSSFAWLRGQVRFLRYSSPMTAYYFGCEYQRWTQEFGEDNSILNGWTLNVGLKKSW